MEPKPIKVKPLKNYLLYVLFENGEEKIYDMKNNFKYPFYQKLKDINNFKKVKISGINIAWETGEDIAPENLYIESHPFYMYTEKIEELD